MRISTVFLLTMFFAASPAFAESFDSSYNGNGRDTWFHISGANFKGVALLELPSGNLAAVFTHDADTCSGAQCLRLLYLDASGTYISSFSNLTRLQTISGATVDSAGRIIVVGTSLAGPQGTDMLVVRIRPNGELDLAFGNNGFMTIDFFGQDDDATAVAVDRNDNVVVAGVARLSSDDADFAVARLRSSNGSLDTSFNNGGRATVAFDLAATLRLDIALSVAITNNNRILLAGFAADGGISRYRGAMARLNSNGVLDSTLCPGGCGYSASYPGLGNGKTAYYFGLLTAHTDLINDIDSAGDGSIYIVGQSYLPDGSERRSAITRFTSTGAYTNEVLSAGLGGNARFNSLRLSDALPTRVIAAGESGPGGQHLLTQAFSGGLTPASGYGSCLINNSGFCFSNYDAGDFGPNQMGELTLDRTGRPLLAATVISLQGQAQAMLLARFTNTSGPKPDLIFRSGFQ